MQTFDFFILGAVFGLVIFYKFSLYYRRRKRQLIAFKAKKGESSAVKFLQNAGYEIIDRQKRIKIQTKVNGSYYTNTIIADLLVKKGNKTYLVEIKTGKQMEKNIPPQIRRQLLEYFLVFKPDGLILLDMEQKKLHHLSFELDNTKEYTKPLGYVASFFVGILFTWIYLLLK